MTSGFQRTATGRIVLRADEVERGLLRTLAEQVIAFVQPDDEPDPGDDPLHAIVGALDGSSERPDDPALARLLPDAYLDDPEASADFRRFTEGALREQKEAHARAVLDGLARSGSKVTLSEQELPSWLGFLNDARLALGVRLGIAEDAVDELAGLPEDDPRFAAFHVYDWLTYLQDSLVRLLLPDGP